MKLNLKLYQANKGFSSKQAILQGSRGRGQVLSHGLYQMYANNSWYFFFKILFVPNKFDHISIFSVISTGF